ncbi:hypothetical protein [Deinococcus koreensis]|uniref:Uncharacterized protein n=1 Tax=Deinococcus koreensis TaxID=2054903 RepID=A0A2K3UWX0_9DEIO|nr:hypothetical protein [Deinococcus koreensis]PNY81021.1 hypothetical protein CVO96_06190 [Deinococcus koreensis]
MTRPPDPPAPGQPRPDKGVRGFELDIHVAFTQPLPEAEALSALLVLDGFHVELYRPHPSPTKAVADGAIVELSTLPVPSARLTGPLRDPQTVRAGLTALLQAQARYLEVGRRGFLRSADGRTEWVPWRRNAVLARHDTERVAFEEGVKYILE